MRFWQRKYLVDRSLQMRYSVLFVIIALAGNICSVVIFNVLALKNLDAVMWSTHIGVRTTAEILNPLFISVNTATFIFIAILLIMSGMWMIRKASGPLYRMSRDIDRIAEGNLSVNVSLREKDAFQNVADSLNEMTVRLRTEFSVIHDKCNDISRSLEDLDQISRDRAVSPEDCDTVMKHITDLEAQLDKFQT